MTLVRVGTRGSRLARTQSQRVASALRTHVPDLAVELVPIETLGDKHRNAALTPELGQSVFTKEIESALLEGRVDIAVHSCKDLATLLPRGLRIGAVPEREDPRDVLVSRAGRLEELPAGARIGTCSPRRKSFLALVRPDLEVVALRGNVPTRVAAVDGGTVDAAVLAAAGLLRLGMSERVSDWLDPSLMTPAAAQGALAVQTRADDDATNELVATVDHATSRAEVTAERACMGRLEAGCQAPLGVLARSSAGSLTLDAALVAPDGVFRAHASGRPAAAESLGTAVAEQLLAGLGLDSLRGATWAGPPARRAHA